MFIFYNECITINNNNMSKKKRNLKFKWVHKKKEANHPDIIYWVDRLKEKYG